MMKRMILAVTLALGSVTGAAAQTDYPKATIRLIVPFAPGGSTDSQARIVADAMSRDLGQSVVVVNVGGAGGTIGANQVAKAAPDGYTLITATPSLTINPYIQKDIAYDPLKDFEPVVQVATSPIVLVVGKESKLTSVKDIIELAKAKPDALRYGSAGVGSSTHLSSALFASMAGITLTHVPYRGANPALVDLMAGRLELQFENGASVMQHVESGELKALAIGSAKRSAKLPNLAPIADTVPGYEATSWFGLLAPANTPRPIIERLNASVNKALADAAFQKQLDSLGVERIGGTPEQFGAFIKARVAEMAIVSKAANLQPQ